MPAPRQPQRDSLAPSEPEWQTVRLGEGQAPGLFGEGDFQWSPDFDSLHGEDVRRTPGRETAYVVHKPPEAPA